MGEMAIKAEEDDNSDRETLVAKIAGFIKNLVMRD
jgi:hypothetical protein